jgi:hypothetical protein
MDQAHARLHCLVRLVRLVRLTYARTHTCTRRKQHLGELSAKARALDVVDSDVDYHYHGLKLQQPVIDPSSMKRVHRAQLPGREAERLVETLGKIAAIAKSRQEYAHGLEQATEQLRKLEFAKERAESMAVARGAALLKCQEALSDAEEQQVQLGGMLRSALEQLGVGDIGDIGRRDWMGGAGALMSTPDHANHANHSHHAHHAHHSSMRFRYSNVTPPSRRQRPASSFKDTPMTGFTVYSNPVSEATEHGDFATPARTNTYYSDEEEGQRDGRGGSGARSRESRLDTRASIGAETAQKLAREVLPHLGSSEIAYLVEYNLKEKEKERDRARGATDPRREPVWTNGTHAETNAATRNIKTKTSTFHIGGGPHADGDFVIRAGVDLSNGNGGIDAIGAIDQRAGYDGIPSVERRRNAAARIVAKLNERLPRELHISSLTGMDE